MKIQNNIMLKNHTTFRIGGPAKYFFVAKTKDQLVRALAWAKSSRTPFFILGGGSNLLISDKGFNGLVIKIENCKLKIGKLRVYAEAGVILSIIVSEVTKKDLANWGWASGIPGTVGGAIYGNAGTRRQSIKDIVESVDVLDAKTGKIKKFKNKDCQFYYRESIFKKNRNLVILSAVFILKKTKGSSAKSDHQKFISYRRATQPLNFPSIGSIFKGYKKDGEIISAGYFIEKCGLKGKKIGDAQISEKHANFIVNLGEAKSKDVLALIKLSESKVKKKFGIKLVKEIQFLG